MLNLSALLIAALVWAGTLTAAFFYGVSTGDDKATAAVAREERVARVVTAAATSAAASAIAGIEIKQVTIRQKATTEIRRDPIYIDCRHPQAVLDLINRSLTNVSADPLDLQGDSTSVQLPLGPRPAVASPK